MLKVRLNLRKVFAVAICLAGITTMYAQVETDVEINGVKWATCNVNSPGSFTDSPESSGLRYQWNRINGWTGGDSNVTDFDKGTPTGTTWEKINDPSPVGYRVPTYEEIENLLDTNKVTGEWIIQNGVRGRKFTDKKNGNSIFLPALGSCFINCCCVGTFDYPNGLYWSSTQDDSESANGLYFDGNSMFQGGYSRNLCVSVRPVKDSNTGINEILIDTEKAIVIGCFDILGRKLKEKPTTGFYIIQYANGKTKKISGNPRLP